MSTEVHIIAGDNDGGPHIHATLRLKCDANISDAELAERREEIESQFAACFGEPPSSVIVYVDDEASA